MLDPSAWIVSFCVNPGSEFDEPESELPQAARKHKDIRGRVDLKIEFNFGPRLKVEYKNNSS